MKYFFALILALPLTFSFEEQKVVGLLSAVHELPPESFKGFDRKNLLASVKNMVSNRNHIVEIAPTADKNIVWTRAINIFGTFSTDRNGNITQENEKFFLSLESKYPSFQKNDQIAFISSLEKSAAPVALEILGRILESQTGSLYERALHAGRAVVQGQKNYLSPQERQALSDNFSPSASEEFNNRIPLERKQNSKYPHALKSFKKSLKKSVKNRSKRIQKISERYFGKAPIQKEIEGFSPKIKKISMKKGIKVENQIVLKSRPTILARNDRTISSIDHREDEESSLNFLWVGLFSLILLFSIVSLKKI